MSRPPETAALVLVMTGEEMCLARAFLDKALEFTGGEERRRADREAQIMAQSVWQHEFVGRPCIRIDGKNRNERKFLLVYSLGIRSSACFSGQCNRQSFAWSSPILRRVSQRLRCFLPYGLFPTDAASGHEFTS